MSLLLLGVTVLLHSSVAGTGELRWIGRNLRLGNVSREDLAAKRMPYNPSLPPLVLHGAACRSDLGDNKAEAHRSMPFAPRLSCGAPVLLVATASRSLQSYVLLDCTISRGITLLPPKVLYVTCHLDRFARCQPGSPPGALVLRQAKRRGGQAGEDASQLAGPHPAVKPEVTYSRRSKSKMSRGELEAQCLRRRHLRAPPITRE